MIAHCVVVHCVQLTTYSWQCPLTSVVLCAGIALSNQFTPASARDHPAQRVRVQTRYQTFVELFRALGPYFELYLATELRAAVQS